jgi:hypothetical protein
MPLVSPQVVADQLAANHFFLVNPNRAKDEAGLPDFSWSKFSKLEKI